MTKNMTYKTAGVDIQKADKFIDFIRINNKSIGDFSGLFPVSFGNETKYIAASTDGVGTKLVLAIQCNNFSGVGIDLVAMCVNDIICSGATPLFFLDYIATGKLNLNILKQIFQSIQTGCRAAGIQLLGGETAEMPGFYDENKFDLAGFAVGMASKEELFDKSNISSGDIIIGLKSNGIHSNGYSLVRKIIEDNNIDIMNTTIDNVELYKTLLEPTKIYINDIKYIKEYISIKGIAHITGGGLHDNISRILSENAELNFNYNWDIPNIFKWLQDTGNIAEEEMFKVFNMGIGLAIIISRDDESKIIELFQKNNIDGCVIGNIK